MLWFPNHRNLFAATRYVVYALSYLSVWPMVGWSNKFMQVEHIHLLTTTLVPIWPVVGLCI